MCPRAAAAVDRTAAMTALIDQFDGDATAALLVFARHAEIAVAWMDRDYFARHFRQRGVELTDERWARITAKMDDFDNYVGDTFVHSDYGNCWLNQLGLDEATDCEPDEN